MLKNTLWNVLGLVVPSLIAIPAMAIMARALGVEKFGLFMLAFSVLGYAGIFDGGLTRAVIRAVAMHDHDRTRNRLVVGTASCAVLALSLVAALLVYFGAEQITRLLNVSEASHQDAVLSFKLLAFIIPPYLLGLIWFAYPEGQQRFFQLNILKTITGSLIALLPVVAILIEPSFFYALIGLLVARVLSLAVAYIPCHRDLGSHIFSFNVRTLKSLLGFGGWITVSNIISPLMVYADRFILSNVVGASRVAFYTAPSEAVARMSVIPGAVSRTIFPLFSKMQGEATSAARTAFRGLLVVCILIALPVFVFSEQILTLWLGAPYGAESSLILKVLLVGFVFNAVAQVPYSRLQAHGLAKTTALIHLWELVPYLAVLAVLLNLYGVLGAAIAWTLRVSADFFVLQFFSKRLERQ